MNQFYIEKALEYIHQHLDQELSLERVSGQIGISPYHFHRLFRHDIGRPLGEYIRLTRLQKASEILALQPHESISNIALSVGYQSLESFSREFSKVYGYSPSAFRKNKSWEQWKTDLIIRSEINYQIDPSQIEYSRRSFSNMHGIKIFPKKNDSNSLQSFIAWRQEMKLNEEKHPCFSIYPSDYLDKEELFYIACEPPENLTLADTNWVKIPLHEGLYASLKAKGSFQVLEQAIDAFFSYLLDTSKWAIIEKEILIQRLNLSSNQPPTQKEYRIYIPVDKDECKN